MGRCGVAGSFSSMRCEKNTKRFIVSGISLPVKASRDDAFGKAEKALLKFFSRDEIISLNISKRSVDARKKNDIQFVYSVSAEIDSEKTPDVKDLAKCGIAVSASLVIDAVPGTEKLDGRPVIVGFGPGGMFCAYILAKYGYKPIVIERGSSVEKRIKDVELFREKQILNTESNIQFGAGGAGTFSDGKLMTRINDGLCGFVIDTFHKLGAPDNILYDAKPHIGTDYLVKIVDNMLGELASLGAEVRFDTRMDGISESFGKVKKIQTSQGEIDCGALVLALGHSARDTVKALRQRNLIVAPKAFSVGVRIEHLQENIDRAMYGKFADSGLLPHAEYSLSTHIDGRGVYTFCMCPGGEVVAAASEEHGVVTNGMSRHSRDGKNANSAVCVSVLPEDFGGTVEAGENFVRNIERRAFYVGGNGYFAPAQTVGSLLRGQKNDVGDVFPTYMDGKVTMTEISGVFPEFVQNALRAALSDFDRRIKGFACDDAILTAPETRTSSPVRMPRNPETFIAEGFDNIYPCGEGAGYAGGITSAAVDGMKTALAIIKRYSDKTSPSGGKDV